MSASAGRESVKAIEQVRTANRDRMKAVRVLQSQWVFDGELTAAELVAERDRLRAECMARHPEWFGATA